MLEQVRGDLIRPRAARPGGAASPGHARRALLDTARMARPDVLLLDEPSQDLDAAGVAWLAGWLARWAGALVVVTHDRRLLRLFDCFFVVAESGCREPAPMVLVLDEPTDPLDLPGIAALERVLAAWPGGLVVVSHDTELLEHVGMQQFVELPMARGSSHRGPRTGRVSV